MTELAEWLASIAAVLVLAWAAFTVARMTSSDMAPITALGAMFAAMGAIFLFALAFNMPALDQPAVLDACRESGGVQMAYVGDEWACVPAEQAG